MKANPNPLLVTENTHRLKAIPFDKIKTEHYLPAFEQVLAETKAAIEKLKKSKAKPTFENTIEAMGVAEEHLDMFSSVFFNLLSCESDDEFKALAQQISPMLSQFSSEISTDPVIFEKVKAVYEAEVAGKPAPELPADLTDKKALQKAERYRIIERSYTGLIRNGALLSDEDKKKLTAIDMEMSRLAWIFPITCWLLPIPLSCISPIPRKWKASRKALSMLRHTRPNRRARTAAGSSLCSLPA